MNYMADALHMMLPSLLIDKKECFKNKLLDGIRERDDLEGLHNVGYARAWSTARMELKIKKVSKARTQKGHTGNDAGADRHRQA